MSESGVTKSTCRSRYKKLRCRLVPLSKALFLSIIAKWMGVNCVLGFTPTARTNTLLLATDVSGVSIEGSILLRSRPSDYPWRPRNHHHAQLLPEGFTNLEMSTSTVSALSTPRASKLESTRKTTINPRPVTEGAFIPSHLDGLAPQHEGLKGGQAIPRKSTEPTSISVRVATVADDLDIVNLRLSVFADFSAEMRRRFRDNCCHVLNSRRHLGATCIVACLPGSETASQPERVVGTAECSFHEFRGTLLGRLRPPNSMLYLTEVAVSPGARLKGIGNRLMGSIDQLAILRGVETLYLHVEVTNTPALRLYERAGFSKVPTDDLLYSEFSKSLNLHDGATTGKIHYLMQKELKEPTWLPNAEAASKRGTLGFQITE